MVGIIMVLAALLGGCSAPTGSGPSATTFRDILRPDVTGRSPAVVLLHGCSGVQDYHYDWARTLRGWGYVVLVDDSFTARGLTTVCGVGGARVTPTTMADDAFAALDHLRSLPFVDPARIGVIGFSFGGGAALEVASRGFQDTHHPGKPGFRASVAFYPLCEVRHDIAIPLLILQGDADDLASPAANCTARVKDLAGQGKPVRITVFPGAGHAFDDMRNPNYDSAAERQAEALVRAFLAKSLQ
ncbi:MAG TPA: dienelactone hydrolase family protein [Acetobacteraceae bacterium]|nr:dienelactone hydrolase family protein [Acetobacteraceae bacterium]